MSTKEPGRIKLKSNSFRRPRVVAFAALTVAGLAVVSGIGLSAQADDQPAGQTRNNSSIQGAQGISTEDAAQFSKWASDYDPAEVKYLFDTKDANFGDVSDDLLVSTLEFRRTCRFLGRAVEASESKSSVDRAAAVDDIMAPQLQRVGERAVDGDESQKHFGALTEQVKSGDLKQAQEYLDTSCSRSFGPWQDK